MSQPKPEPPQPRDVSDGIPDRASGRPAWKYLALAGAFAVWVVVMIVLYLLGRPS